MKVKKIWLYLEQYVYFEKSENGFFIYNEYNQFFWEQKNILDNTLLRLINNLDNKTEETRIAELQYEDLSNEQIQLFIKNIRHSFSGDVLSNLNFYIPFVPRQNIHIVNDVEFMKVDSEYLMNYNLKLSITEISINTSVCEIGSSGNTQLFKEGKLNKRKFPIYWFLPNIEEQIEKFRSLRKVNIICYKDSLLDDIRTFIEKTKTVPVCIHIELRNAQKVMDFLGSKYNYFVYFDPTKKEILKYIELSTKTDYNIIPYIQIRNNAEMEQIDFLKQSYQFSIRPYPVFTGNNQSFFVDNFSKTLTDVLSLKPTIKEILTNGIINKNFFGKVHIDEQANISTLGEDSELNLKKYTIIDHAYNERKFKEKWFMTRQKVRPCINCIYRNLCPPISNYEFLMNKYNFCNFA